MSKPVLQQPKKPAKSGKLKQIFSQKRLYSFHSWIGVFVGLLMLLIGFTGSVAVFKPELDWALTPALRVSPGETKVTIEQVVATVSQAYPDRVIKDVELQTGERWAHIVKVKKYDDHHGNKHAEMHEDEDEHENESEIFVNPYTGNIEGERQGESAAELVKKFHTNMWLNLRGGDFGKVGRLIVCAFGVMLVILSLTGFWIYRNKRKSLFKVRFTYGRRILMSDMHKVLGVWTIAFNLMIGITATAWGAKEVGNLFKHEHEHHDREEQMHHDEHTDHGAMAAKGEKVAKYKKGKKAQMAEVTGSGTGAANYDTLVASAAAAIPEMHIEKVEIKGEHGEVKVKGKASGTVIPQQNVHVEMAAGTGEIVMIKDDRSDPVASRLYKFMEPLHFGTLAAGGSSWLEYLVKSLWAILGMSPGVLSITGFVMYYLRKKAAATRKAAVPARVSRTVRELATDVL